MTHEAPAWFREGKLVTSSVALAHKGVPRLPAGIPQERRELTPRERQIVVLASAGMSASEMCCRLGISPHTVRNHLKNIYRKCDAHNRTEILLYAIRQRWLGSDGRPAAAVTR